MLLCSSAVALAYNLTHYLLLQRTSSITVTVLGEVKIVGLIILSAVLLPGDAGSWPQPCRRTASCGLPCLPGCAGGCGTLARRCCRR